jgi:hypothetical protein
VERATRIELAFSAWEADVLPLNYARESASLYRAATHMMGRYAAVAAKASRLAEQPSDLR